MQILNDKYFDQYKQQLKIDFGQAVAQIKEMALTPQRFTFYTSVAVISSSRIEGEQMEIDSFLKHKIQNIEYLPELVEKPMIYFRHIFLQKKITLPKTIFCKAIHYFQNIYCLKNGVELTKSQMLVMEHATGNIQFEAAPFHIVESEKEKLWDDISALLKKNLNIEEIFYYASFIHIVSVNIHPFNDGNGRAARLLEKWFLAEMLGEAAWYIQSEKYYYHHVNDYYRNLNRLGMFYEKLDYANAGSFLQMLPKAINYKE